MFFFALVCGVGVKLRFQNTPDWGNLKTTGIYFAFAQFWSLEVHDLGTSKISIIQGRHNNFAFKFS